MYSLLVNFLFEQTLFSCFSLISVSGARFHSDYLSGTPAITAAKDVQISVVDVKWDMSSFRRCRVLGERNAMSLAHVCPCATCRCRSGRPPAPPAPVKKPGDAAEKKGEGEGESDDKPEGSGSASGLTSAAEILLKQFFAIKAGTVDGDGSDADSDDEPSDIHVDGVEDAPGEAGEILIAKTFLCGGDDSSKHKPSSDEVHAKLEKAIAVTTDPGGGLFHPEPEYHLEAIVDAAWMDDVGAFSNYKTGTSAQVQECKFKSFYF